MLYLHKAHNFSYQSSGEDFPQEENVPEMPHLELWRSYPKHWGWVSALCLMFTCEKSS